MAETTQATSAADGAPNVGFPPFETATYGGQLLWLAITFGALYYLMSKLVLPRLTGIIETRQATIARDLDDAALMKERAQVAGASYERSLAEAKARAQALAQQTRDQLSAETDARRKAIEADLATRLAASEATIAETKAAAMSNVRAIAADTASAIVERLTGQAPTAQAVDAALDGTARAA